MSKYSQNSIVHKKSVLSAWDILSPSSPPSDPKYICLFYMGHDMKLLIKMVPDVTASSFNVKKKEIQLRQVLLGLVCLKTSAGSI